VCGLKFERVEPNEECEIKISFLTDHDDLNTANKFNCPYIMKGQKNGTLAHAFYPGKSSICGDIHFHDEIFTYQKKRNRVMGNTIYFL